MGENIIKIHNLTKDYGNGRGIFDINFEIKKGQVFGYVGTNGSGKTTTIRNLMGFVKPDKGNASIMGYDSWTKSTEIMQYVSYVPGEIAFPSLATGTEFLKLQAEYLGVTDFTYMNNVISLLQLDPTANLKSMSKGMKQKTALVAALMANKDIIVLDEPTTGLDPLMRDSFLELIREEKKKGRTILMSSHIFEEIEDVCDKVAMIRDGKIIDVLDLWDLRHWKSKTFKIKFIDVESYKTFAQSKRFEKECSEETLEIKVEFPVEKIKEFFAELTKCKVATLREEHITLEQYFRQIYSKGDK